MKETVVYFHGVGMKATFAGPKKSEKSRDDENEKQRKNRRHSLSPPRSVRFSLITHNDVISPIIYSFSVRETRERETRQN